MLKVTVHSVMLLILLGGTVRAEEERISVLLVKGNRRIETATILNVVHLKAGDLLTNEKVDADLRAIYKLGHFQDVQAEVTRSDKQVVLTYQVGEKPIVVSMLWGVLRLLVFNTIVFPLTYAIPLLLCVWTCNVTMLWLMAAAYAVMQTALQFWILPSGLMPPWADWATYAATLFNIVVAALIVHAIILLREQADVSAASQIPDKIARRTFIYNRLAETASHSAELFQWLEKQGTQPHRLLVVNAIAATINANQLSAALGKLNLKALEFASGRCGVSRRGRTGRGERLQFLDRMIVVVKPDLPLHQQLPE